MKTFTYPHIAKIIYKYANIPITIVLSFYLAVSAFTFTMNWISIFPFIVNLALIIVINNYYAKMYRMMPYVIQTDDMKLVCSGFTFSRRVIEIKLKDIVDISGGILAGYKTKPVYVTDSSGKAIMINSYIKNFRELLTVILSGVKDDLYKQILERVKQMQPDAGKK